MRPSHITTEGIDEPAQFKGTDFANVELDIKEEAKHYSHRVQAYYLAILKTMHGTQNPPEATLVAGSSITNHT